MIIDSHTHVPEKRDDWPEFIGSCHNNNVSGVITSSLAGYTPWPDAQQVRETNAYAKAFAESAGSLVKWLAYLNPHHDHCLEELETCLNEGAVGIKLWLSIKSQNGSLEKSFPVLHTASQKKLPVLIHVMNRTDPVHAGELDMADFAVLARRFPQATLIAAHAGANWRHSLGLLRGLKNAYMDISGFLAYKDIVKELIADLGVERILFGSDYPVRDIGAQLAKVYFAEIRDREKQYLLWQNAANIYGFESPESPNIDLGSMTRLDVEEDILVDFSVDHCCFSGSLPFSMGATSPAQFDSLLKECHIEKAFTACTDNIYRMDIAAANENFRTATKNCERIEPLATLDPTVANWQHTLQVAAESFTGGIVFPYLHNWQLDDNACQAFFQECAQKNFPLWVNCCFDDYRIRHRGLASRPVSSDELSNFAKNAPDNTYVFQGLEVEQADLLLSVKDGTSTTFKIVISRLTDRPQQLEQVVRKHGMSGLVFGSEYPIKDLRTVSWLAKNRLGSFLIPE